MALVARSNDRDERQKSTPIAEARSTAVEFTPLTLTGHSRAEMLLES
jgi:hypothetical protein